MAYYTNNNHCDNGYASNAKANTAVTLASVLGGIGTLNAVGGGGILGNLFGGGQTVALQQQVMQLTADKAKLESEKYTDYQVSELFKAQTKENKDLNQFLFNVDKRITSLETAAPLREQILRGEIAQTAQAANCCCNALTAQLQALQATFNTIVTPVVKNSAICPGWGDVTVTPATTTTTTAA